MKHGFLITAYKDIEQLIELVGWLGPDAAVFIHFDRKSPVPAALMSRLRGLPTVKLVSRRYAVNWGGTNLLRSILELARAGVEDAELSYLHLITASDYPVVPRREFEAFFERHRGTEFIRYRPLPIPHWDGGGLQRLEYYHPLDVVNVRKRGRRHLLKLLLTAQKYLRVRRAIDNLPRLYGGSAWWSLSRECVVHVLKYCEHDPKYLRSFRHTFCGEEIFFQTAIMNSSFADNVVNDNLRYIDWNRRNGNSPAVLDETDLARVLASGKLFARKLDRPTSNALLEELRKRVVASCASASI